MSSRRSASSPRPGVSNVADRVPRELLSSRVASRLNVIVVSRPGRSRCVISRPGRSHRVVRDRGRGPGWGRDSTRCLPRASGRGVRASRRVEEAPLVEEKILVSVGDSSRAALGHDRSGNERKFANRGQNRGQDLHSFCRSHGSFPSNDWPKVEDFEDYIDRGNLGVWSRGHSL
jgi:hypothetical protein